VVPTLNEAENVRPLVERIDATLRPIGVTYEVLFVDDHSSDDTQARILALAQKYPVRLSIKQGSRGKAFSLLQGFEEATYDVVCMIDADLQYPPEAIAPMLTLIHNGFAEVVVTRRIHAQTSFARKLFSKAFNFIFIRLLFKIEYDTQSGLKVFNKHILDNMVLRPTPWSFDLEFIIRSLENNHTVMSHDIDFESRTAGEPKVNLLKTSIELAKASVSLWRRSSVKHVRDGYTKSLHLERNVGLPLFIIFSFILVTAQPVSAVSLDKAFRDTVNTVLNRDDTQPVPVDQLPSPVPTNPVTPANPVVPPAPTNQPATTQPSSPTQPTAQPVQPTAQPVQPSAPTPLNSQNAPSLASPVNQPAQLSGPKVSDSQTQVIDEQTGSGNSCAYPATKLSAQSTSFYNNISKYMFLVGLLIIGLVLIARSLHSLSRSASKANGRSKATNA